MRHTAITKLVQAGVDIPTIQRISGHKTVAMVLRYTHVHGQHIDQAIKAIGRGLPLLARPNLAYLVALPTEIPAGKVLVHNQVRPTRRLGLRGFRAWLADADPDHQAVCPCTWAPELGVHYRVSRDEQGPSGERDYTGITQAARRRAPTRTKENGEKSRVSKNYRLKAGSGIEPLYEDLQSSA